MSGVVLDAGALIAFERNDRRVVALVKRARQRGDVLVIPAGVVGQVWRDGRRQARLAVLLASTSCRVDVLDDATARRAGQLLGVSATSDVIDASVVLSARFHRVGVVTSDPEDLHRLDPRLDLTIV